MLADTMVSTSTGSLCLDLCLARSASCFSLISSISCGTSRGTSRSRSAADATASNAGPEAVAPKPAIPVVPETVTTTNTDGLFIGAKPIKDAL